MRPAIRPLEVSRSGASCESRSTSRSTSTTATLLGAVCPRSSSRTCSRRSSLHRRHSSAHMATLKGMSVGAMVPVLELFAVNSFEELEPMLEAPEGGLLFLQRKEGYLEPPPPPSDRCSSFAVVAEGTTILAHNEHWLAGDRENVAVVIEMPEDRPVSVASPTIVCCLPAVGMNSHGGRQHTIVGDATDTGRSSGISITTATFSRSPASQCSLWARIVVPSATTAKLEHRSLGGGGGSRYPSLRWRKSRPPGASSIGSSSSTSSPRTARGPAPSHRRTSLSGLPCGRGTVSPMQRGTA